MPYRTVADNRHWIRFFNLSLQFMLGLFWAVTVTPKTCWRCVSLLFAALHGCLHLCCSNSNERHSETLLAHADCFSALQLVATPLQYLSQQEW